MFIAKETQRNKHTILLTVLGQEALTSNKLLDAGKAYIHLGS
jgi:hypothetical protein